MPKQRSIYFLCTGNSCRSQIAEGWAKNLGAEWIVRSAWFKSKPLKRRRKSESISLTKPQM